VLTVKEALGQGIRLLDEAAVPVPRLTAEVLLCHALRKERVYLYAHPEEPLSEVAWIHYGRYLHQRIGGMPTQYITKEQEFYGRPFHVSPAVLIPRPETEHVVEAALRYARQARVVADIGCGSGAIAVTLALEMPQATVYGLDISGAALQVARRNAEALGASDRQGGAAGGGAGARTAGGAVWGADGERDLCAADSGSGTGATTGRMVDHGTGIPVAGAGTPDVRLLLAERQEHG
jgi:methylase of polypeptide subunit release factors